MTGQDQTAPVRPEVLMFPAGTKALDNPSMLILRDSIGRRGIHPREYRPMIGGSAEIFHLHWPERAVLSGLARRSVLAARWQAARLLRTMERTRDRGGRVFWTVHNLAPHDRLCARRSEIWEQIVAGLVRYVTDVILLEDAAADMVRGRFPGLSEARFRTIPLPHYRGYFARCAEVEPPDALGGLPPDAVVFLMAGHVRSYKGVNEAIRSFASASGDDLRLVVAGKTSGSYGQTVRDAAAADARVMLIDRRISDAELVHLHRRANLALFNFSRIHNSGSVRASLSLGCPVAAPDIGLIGSLAAHVGEDHAMLFSTLDERIIEQLAQRFRQRPNTPVDLSFYDPDRVAQLHADAYFLD